MKTMSTKVATGLVVLGASGWLVWGRVGASSAAADTATGVSHGVVDVARVVAPGRRVRAADVISREELDRAASDVDVARARQAQARERARLVDAPARGHDRARARAAVQQARARVLEAEALFAKTVVRAPIAGTILHVAKRPGESVSVEAPAGAHVVTIADLSVLRVRADVDERDVAHLRAGQRAYVTADAYGSQRFTGRVIRVSQMLGRKNIRSEEPTEKVDTKVLETLIELDPGQRLPIGLRVDAFIER